MSGPLRNTENGGDTCTPLETPDVLERVADDAADEARRDIEEDALTLAHMPQAQVEEVDPLDLIEFDGTQLAAVTLCTDMTRRIVPITGPAGTGKTTIMRKVARELRKAGYRVVACAPTGKAARRIREATGLEAMTIHRLLEYPYPGERDAKTGEPKRPGFPQRDRYNPLEYDVVLADEYAMVNHEVHANLVDALPRNGCLRAFGDMHQLPPIENSAILAETSPFQKLLKTFAGVRLERIHRQGEGSGIVAAGAAILVGKGPQRRDDFAITITEKPIDALSDLVLEALDQGIDFRTLQHQIITPTRKSWVGTAKLNVTLQQLLNPQLKQATPVPRHSWALDKDTKIAIGDKVLWTQNNYELNIMNGDTGIVEDITDVEEFVINWGDRTIAVPPQLSVTRKDGTLAYIDPRKDLDLAYAVTTHKSQGSEYQHVVYILNKSSSFMQERSNYYTAITRARKHVTVITDQSSFFNALKLARPASKKKGMDQ